MDSITRKRLISLTKVFIVVFALSLVSLVHKYDSKDLQQDVRSLDLIMTVGNLSPNIVVESREMSNKALTWLDNNNDGLAKLHRGVRQQFTDILLSHNISKGEIEAVKIGSSGNFQGLPIRFSLIEIIADSDFLKSTVAREPVLKSLTVNEALNRFDFLTTPRPMIVATQLRETKLSKFESFDRRQATFRLVSVLIHESLIQVWLVEDASSVGFSQRPPQEIRDALAAETETVTIPSIFSLLEGQNPDIEKLRGDTSQLRRLRLSYGNMKFDLAQQLAAEELSQSYKSISIFGLTFSTRRYPIAILLFSFLSALGIILVIESANRGQRRTIPEAQEEDMVSMLLSNTVVRTLMWVILPPLAIWASLPNSPLGITEATVLYVGMAIVGALGIFSVIRIRDLRWTPSLGQR